MPVGFATPWLLAAASAIQLVAPEGEACPSVAAVEAAIDQLDLDLSASTLTVTWAREPGGLRVRIEAEGREGTTERSIPACPCDDLADALALVVARSGTGLVDPRLQRPRPKGREGGVDPLAEAPAPRAPPPAEPKPEGNESETGATRRSEAPPVPVSGPNLESRAGSTWHLSLRAGPLLAFSGRVRPGGALSVEGSSSVRPFGVVVSAALTSPRNHGRGDVTVDINQAFFTGGLLVRTPLMPRIGVGGSAAGLLTHTRVRSTGIVDSPRVQNLSLGGRIAGFVETQLDPIELRLELGLRAHGGPRIYRAAPATELARLPILEGELLVSVGVRFLEL